MDIICYPSVGEEQVADFETIFLLLDTCGKQVILKLYKHEDICNMTIHKDKTDKNEEPN